MSDQSVLIEQEIIKLTHEWMDAVGQRDRATLERILGNDFLIAGWQPRGRLGDKQFYIQDCLMPLEFEQAKYSYDRWHLRMYDKVVIANCILECHALVAGKEWGGVFLNTYAWINRINSWQVVTCHSSAVVNPQGEVAG
ncbi:MAG TPA: nuclear transport factor 2 family protein [Acidobacteriota bacterium]|nr:nuclear transport factor 2 family protein [Acidobacteriota bacterium]